ncbi:MAG: hydrophobe/amphiphile efflux-3 (HAE3) family transporter [Archaeoglobaceae archaeon]
MLEKVAKFVTARPGLVVSVIAVVLMLSAVSSQNVKLSSGTESMFSEDDVVYMRYKLYQKEFGVSSDSLFVFVKGDDVVSRDVYELMLELQRRIEEIEGVGSTVSPASVIVEIAGYLPADEAELERLSDVYAKDLLPKPTLALIVVSLETSDRDRQKEIAKEVERVLETAQLPPSLELQLTGRAALSIQIEREIVRSLGITMTASILMMILILYLTFSGVVRRKLTAFIPLIISVMSVQILYGLMPLLGIPLSEHTNGALPMLIGLAIEYGAQLQNRYEEERREGRRSDEAAVIATTRTGLAIAMALLTTVIGFMSMMTPGIPAMTQFGLISSLGLIITYVLTITFLPALLKMIDRGGEGGREEGRALIEASLEKIAVFTANRPLAILVATVIVVILGAYASQLVELETNYNKYVPQNLPAIQRFKELESLVGGQAVYTLVISVDEIDSSTLEKLKEVAEYVKSREELVYDYDSVTKIVDSVIAAYGLDESAAFSVFSSLPEERKRAYVSGNLVAIHFKSDADSQEEYVGLWRSIENDVRYFGFSDFYVTGSPVLYGHMGDVMIGGQTTMTFAAYAFVVTLLLVVYRSVRKAVVPLVAITSVIATMNIFMVLFGIKQTMLSIALNSITLGLGIDFSIHILERYFEERENYDPMSAVRRTVERTGKAITTSALTMAGGFGSLAFSPFPILSDFGIIAFVAIVFSLLAALTVAPAFLMVTERFGR